MNEETAWAPRPRCCPPAEARPPLADPDEELALLAKALGHPARVKILRMLLEREECVCGEICDVLPLAQSTVSQHLKVLREVGLIHGETDGTRVCYCADEDRLRSLRDLLDGVMSLARTPTE